MKAHDPSTRSADRHALSRRRFLRHSAVAGAGLLGCPAILTSAAPNSLLQVACIGVGGMGGSTMKSVASHPKVKIVALCDVDERTLDAAAKTYPDASRHKDWRELLSKHADKFDAVTIGTPDHMHAAPAVTALRAKKHVYLQKPMAATLHECRVITEEAAKAGVVTQLGNQGRSSIESRMTVELHQERRDRQNQGSHPVGKQAAQLVAEEHRHCARKATRSRRVSTGTCGWACASRGPTSPTRIIPRIGGPGSISAWARWATWVATTSTRRLTP